MRWSKIAYSGLVVSLIMMLMACTQDREQIAFGPYLQNMTSESVVICWTTLEGESKVIAPDSSINIIHHYKMHEVPLARLKPESTYKYDILGDGSPAGMGSFTTFPEEVKPFRFVVLGDTRSRHDIHTRIVNRIIEQKPMLVISTGDLVSNGDNIQDWEKFFEINKKLIHQVPYFPVLGNHEHDAKFYYKFFNLPGNEHYYHFSIGDVLFLFLDSEGPEFETPEYIKNKNKEKFWNTYNLNYLKQEKAWAEHILNLHDDAGFIFVFFHKPLISIMKSRLKDAKMRREFWGDIFERHRVQVIMNGHDHHYHHAFSGGTHYITTAGGGANLYEPDAPQPETVKYAKIEHFVTVDVSLQEAKLTAIDINGQIIDEIKVLKRN